MFGKKVATELHASDMKRNLERIFPKMYEGLDRLEGWSDQDIKILYVELRDIYKDKFIGKER